MNTIETKLSGLTIGDRILPKLFIGLAVIVSHQTVNASPVDLGSAAGFGALAGAGITNTGPTTIYGDMGTFPTATITDLGSITLHGTNHANDSLTQQGKIDLATAYNDALVRVATTTYAPIFDLGGLSLLAGVYKDSSSFGLTGNLTLDAQNDPNAVWIFQAGSTLTTAASSNVILINGAQAQNIFWQVGSSATLGTNSNFAGNILAQTSITMTTGASVAGGLYAQDGAVTFDTNNVTAAPEPGGALLFITGMAALIIFRRRGQK